MKLHKLYFSLLFVVLIWFAIIAFMIYLHIDHPRPEDSLKSFIGIVFTASAFITMPPLILYTECLYRHILPQIDRAIDKNSFYDSPVFDYDFSIKSFLSSIINPSGVRHMKLMNYAMKICIPWIEKRHRKHKYYEPVDFDKLPKNLRIPLITYFYWFVLEILFIILAGILLYNTP